MWPAVVMTTTLNEPMRWSELAVQSVHVQLDLNVWQLDKQQNVGINKWLTARSSSLIQGIWHTHARLTALCPGLPGWAGTRKVKPIWILLKQETVSCSGISWTICKSAPRSRLITTPAPHHSVFYRPDALPAAQPTASKHWRHNAFDHTVNVLVRRATCLNLWQLDKQQNVGIIEFQKSDDEWGKKLVRVSAWHDLHCFVNWFDGQSRSSMHHYECVEQCKDISLQRGQLCTRSLASYIPRSREDRSSWRHVK